jgi:hypothetical protein
MAGFDRDPGGEYSLRLAAYLAAAGDRHNLGRHQGFPCINAQGLRALQRRSGQGYSDAHGSSDKKM